MSSHTFRTLRTSTILLGAAALVTFAGCTRNLDTKKLETFINTQFKEKGIELRSITCPKAQKIKQGDTFDCEAVDAEGKTLAVHVEQQDNKGNISWKLDGAVINLKIIGDSIESKVGASADVQCPERSIVLRVNESFTCDATVGGKPHKVAMTLTDSSGNVSWKIVQ